MGSIPSACNRHTHGNDSWEIGKPPVIAWNKVYDNTKLRPTVAQEGLENRKASTQRDASRMEVEQVESTIYLLFPILCEMWNAR